MTKGRGWFGDKYRHALASHGVKTVEDKKFKGDVLTFLEEDTILESEDFITYFNDEYETKFAFDDDIDEQQLEDILFTYENLMTRRQKNSIEGIIISDTPIKEEWRAGIFSRDKNWIVLFSKDKPLIGSLEGFLLHEAGHNTFRRLKSYARNTADFTDGSISNMWKWFEEHDWDWIKQNTDIQNMPKSTQLYYKYLCLAPKEGFVSSYVKNQETKQEKLNEGFATWFSSHQSGYFDDYSKEFKDLWKDIIKWDDMAEWNEEDIQAKPFSQQEWRELTWTEDELEWWEENR